MLYQHKKFKMLKFLHTHFALVFMTQVLEAEVVARVYPFWSISIFKNSHKDFC